MLKETSTKAKVQHKNNEFQSTGVEKKKKNSKSTTFANTGLHQEGELSYSIFKIVLQG